MGLKPGISLTSGVASEAASVVATAEVTEVTGVATGEDSRV
jgi:hypothetical protein